MAMVRPVLIGVSAWDATQNFTFTFSVASGGNQVVANRLIIRDNVSNEIVYNQKQTTYRYEHTVPADTLTNGNYYNATVTTYDALDDASAASLPIQFYCYSTPSISFTNIPAGGIVSGSSYEFGMVYNQDEDEPLNTYQFNLYNTSLALVSTSGVLYTQDGTPPFNASYTFSGFEEGSIYYVVASGSTVNGTLVTTDLAQITVEYSTPSLHTLIELSNNCDEGFISVRSNITPIEGQSEPPEPTFIDDRELDLTAEGHYVWYDQGFSIINNFASTAWFRNPTLNSKLFEFTDEQGNKFSIIYRNGYVDDDNSTELKAYFELIGSTVQGINYYIYSNYVDILSSSDQYILYVSRVANVFQIFVDTKITPI